MLDLENAPHVGHFWGLFKQNISLNQLMETSYTLCWAAQFYGESKMHFSSIHKTTPKKMLQAVHKLISEADAIVTWNGSRHDLPILNKEFILHGMKPPAPYKQIDLLKTSRSVFKFASNKLDFVSKALGVGQKLKHEGHELWVKCMAGNRKAWKEMEAYNKNDVIILQAVYEKFKPWIKGHANHNLYGKTLVCPNCGSDKMQKRGVATTATLKYNRLQCTSCGKWSRDGESQGPKPDAKYYPL